MSVLERERPAPPPLPAPGGPAMPVVAHLTELRNRLIVSVAALAVGAVVGFALYDPILRWLLGPYVTVTGTSTLFITDPLEGFSTRLKVSGYTGVVLAMPVVLWQLWRFVTPGLHRRERRLAVPFVSSAVGLFVLGAGLAFWTLPKALEFLVEIGGENLETIFSPGKYLGLVTFMMLAFGLAFEFPVVLLFLQLARILPSRRLRDWRRPVAVGIFVFVAIVTPSQDPYSLFALAVPMYAFYELSIVAGRLLKR
ncbi:MAG TPA: twin-arginine translocase subunit TatC [Acidimicrobiales bacterium]|nr:twin-arginine translocase subunit TatC [Acidimicrobiales bacterium]